MYLVAGLNLWLTLCPKVPWNLLVGSNSGGMSMAVEIGSDSESADFPHSTAILKKSTYKILYISSLKSWNFWNLTPWERVVTCNQACMWVFQSYEV